MQGPQSLQLSKNLRQIGLPELTGRPIRVFAQSYLSAYRGRLVPAETSTGTAVYAAAFLRDRKIILESQLVANCRLLRVILMHELFHFVWLHLGNSLRRTFSAIVRKEWESRAGGELGESSDMMKIRLRQLLVISDRSWREYVCESFCDTAAWLYAGVEDDDLFTLRKRWRERRKEWFLTTAGQRPWRC